MKKIIISLLAAIILFGCRQSAKITNSSRSDNIETLNIVSPAVRDNTIGEPEEKTIYVFLPPGYDDSKDRYPVIYFFHGQGSDSTEMLNFETYIFSSMEKGKIEPFIIVAVNGDTSLGGSFYVNSSRTGRWQDHISEELVPLIDKRYRTIAAAESRGLMGFSMGGFGVLNMGLSRPDLFGSVWALCPGILVPEKGLRDALATWRNDEIFLTCYSAAFSEPGKLPAFDGTDEDNKIISEWESGFGNWEPRIDRYLSGEERLKEIRIVYGRVDMYRWIPEGSLYLAGLLKSKSIPVTIQDYPMGHTINAGLVINDAVPFFERTLERSSVRE